MMTIINAIGGFTHLVYTPINRWWTFLAGFGYQLQEIIMEYFDGKIDGTVGLGLAIASLILWGVLLYVGIKMYTKFVNHFIEKHFEEARTAINDGEEDTFVVFFAGLSVLGWFLTFFEFRLLDALGTMIQTFGLVMFAVLIATIAVCKFERLTVTRILFYLLGSVLLTSIIAFLAGAYVYVIIALAFLWMLIKMIGGVFEGGGSGGGGAAAKTGSWTPKDLPANISINGENYGLGKSYSWGAEYTSSSGNSVTITNVYSMGNGEASTNAGHVTYHK